MSFAMNWIQEAQRLLGEALNNEDAKDLEHILGKKWFAAARELVKPVDKELS